MDGFLDFFKDFFKLLITFLANLKTTGLFQLLGLDDLVESLIAKL